jgi:hypothetical protein
VEAKPKAAIVPVTVTTYERDLACDVRRVVGYRAKCACNWQSDHRTTVSYARAELVQHQNARHQ